MTQPRRVSALSMAARVAEVVVGAFRVLTKGVVGLEAKRD